MFGDPLVSVIVTSCNQEKYISEALRSVYYQTHQNWECIIVDDGSTDQSTLKINEWVKKDFRFILVTKPNGGVSSARNTALSLAKGEYIQFLDGDDYLDHSKIKFSLEEVRHSNSKVQLIITNFIMYREEHKKITAPFCELKPEFLNYEAVLLKWEESLSIPIHCGLFLSSLINGIKFPECLKAKEDWVFWIQVFRCNPTVEFIDKPLVTYRKHSYSITMSSTLVEEQIAAIELLGEILDKEEYEVFLKKMCIRYFKSSLYYKEKYLQEKNNINLYNKVILYIKKVQRVFKRLIAIKR